MTIEKKHVEVDTQLAKYYPYCQYKLVASVENQHLPTEYIKIGEEDEKLFFVSQCWPWAQCQGMP